MEISTVVSLLMALLRQVLLVRLCSTRLITKPCLAPIGEPCPSSTHSPSNGAVTCTTSDVCRQQFGSSYYCVTWVQWKCMLLGNFCYRTYRGNYCCGTGATQSPPLTSDGWLWFDDINQFVSFSVQGCPSGYRFFPYPGTEMPLSCIDDPSHCPSVNLYLFGVPQQLYAEFLLYAKFDRCQRQNLLHTD